MFKSAIVMAVASLLCVATFAAPSPTLDLVDTAIAAGNFTKLVGLVQKAGLVNLLRSQNNKFTVFAPTDQAFSRIPQADLDKLAADPVALKQVLLSHIALGYYGSDLLLAGATPKSLQGTALNVGYDNGVLEVNFANILLTDVAATNGVIHVIDAVIGVTQNND